MNSKNAVISVSNKSGLTELATYLFKNGYTIYSTGGTYNHIKREIIDSNNDINSNNNLVSISELTNFPEILGGRVKSLHPLVYGGILNREDNLSDTNDLNNNNVPNFGLVVVNLYPFKKTISDENVNVEKAIENIDIGGVSLIRACAKNYAHKIVLTSPLDYNEFMNINNTELCNNEYRLTLAQKAFGMISEYDNAITEYYYNLSNTSLNKSLNTIRYDKSVLEKSLKYGLNPNQSNSGLYFINSNTDNSNTDNKLDVIKNNEQKPFEILNGNPGYINIMDAINANGLVIELDNYFGSQNKVCATSFKHTSPAGVAYARDLTELEQLFFGVNNDISDCAKAFILSRNCDPKSSFGDFIGISSIVDLDTAKLIKREVCDGIIAPGYTDEALQLLKTKKKGGFIILKNNPDYVPPDMEVRQVGGIVLTQERNTKSPSEGLTHIENDYVRNNLILANTTLKYTQSNSVSFAFNGQVVVAAGQQNRVDCTKLAGEKMNNLLLRNMPYLGELYSKFKSDVKRQERINAIYSYIENDFTDYTEKLWRSLFIDSDSIYLLNDINKKIYLTTHHYNNKNNPLCLASDAFFPFADNIDVANKYNVRYIAQTGGSIRDCDVEERCKKYGIKMYMTGNRFFLH